MTLQLPGKTTRVSARRALVLAPHYDDEVLGCGGLLAQLVAAGAEIRVLFLSDGSGGEGQAEEGRAYGRRRREEAERAGELLGIASSEHLGLPDGELAQHRPAVSQALEVVLRQDRPDLLLAPSPLEVSADHRAAFAALCDVLGAVRSGGELAAAVEELEILLYEVNHPGYPDLLVDVTAQVTKIEAAMACYASQQERHDYLAASLGLRRFRTLTLGPEVKAAEGYRRLELKDFVTRSPAQLIRHLGGVPEVMEVRQGPKVSVVVRTKDRPELLQEALESLAAGSYRRCEVVLVNDGGAPPEVPADYPLPLVRVDLEENQGRAAAANAGIEAASGDFVSFLDDDDLAAAEHLAVLAGAAAGADVRVVYSDAAVGVYELQGQGGWLCVERRLPYSRDFDPGLLLVDNYIPFNTVLLERGLFAQVGAFDTDLPFFEDWDFLIRLAELTPFHHLPAVTCEYRHFRGSGHQILGDRPRERDDFLEIKTRVLAKHAESLTPELLARVVDTLRAELVRQSEQTAHHREQATEAREELQELSDQFHPMRGELAALKGAHDRLLAEHRKTDEELRNTYREIERLNRVIRDMEETKAWRFHQWWQRRVR